MAELQKASPWPFIGIGVIASMGFLYGASARALPVWVVVVLYVVWVPLVVAAVRRLTNTRAVLWLAGVSVGLWVVALAAVSPQLW